MLSWSKSSLWALLHIWAYRPPLGLASDHSRELGRDARSGAGTERPSFQPQILPGVWLSPKTVSGGLKPCSQDQVHTIQIKEIIRKQSSSFVNPTSSAHGLPQGSFYHTWVLRPPEEENCSWKWNHMFENQLNAPENMVYSYDKTHTMLKALH